MNESTRIYLDYAAATPLLPAAFLAMEPFLKGTYGNPSAIHREGQLARQAVEVARETVGRAVQVRPEFITFTSGGTESNHLAIVGIISWLHKEGRAYGDMEIITTALEHPSVSETLAQLKLRGVSVVEAPVDSEGLIIRSAFSELVTAKTVLVTTAYANSEIGVVQPVRFISRTLAEAEQRFGTTIYFHLDGAQAPLWLNCQLETVGADILTLDAGKCHGPKGVGVLLRQRRVHLSSTLFGGGQESGLRPGTENVAGIVGAAVAIADAQASWQERAEAVFLVRDEGISLLESMVQGSVLNGPAGDQRLANNINMSFPGLDTEFLAVVLDSKGIAVSTKSACAGAGGGESTVVRTISDDATRARSTLRLSLSPTSNRADIEQVAMIINDFKKTMEGLTQG